MKKMNSLQIFLIFGGITAWVVYRYFNLGEALSFENLKANQALIMAYYLENPLLSTFFFFVSYVIVTALSLPGATILTLAGGAVFGFLPGLILVSFASTIGATIAFLVARFLLRNIVQEKFRDRVQKINQGIEKQGSFYLLSLRLIPLFPFFLVNLLMGLTKIRVGTFYWVSQIGMLLGTAVFVNAGTQLAKIKSLADVFSFSLLFSLSIIGILPIISKKILDLIRKNKL
jgi:uncharacterized membrane protein YdjX (TVP38/TMEM64 family)